MNQDFHPILVHFAVAFPVLAGFAGGIELVRRRRLPLVDLMVFLGFMGALAAALSGNAALEAYELSQDLLKRAEAHGSAATWAVWVTGVALGLRLGAQLLRKRLRGGQGSPGTDAGRDGAPGTPGASASLLERLGAALAVAAAVLVAVAAARGGTLVHEYGVTRATQPLRAPTERPSYEGFQASPEESPDSSAPADSVGSNSR